MRAEEQIITEMGKLAQMAYKKLGGDGGYNVKDIIPNFEDEGKTYKLNLNYKILDFINTPNDTQALLLERGETNGNGEFKGIGNYVVAFRGTGEVWDGVVDLRIGFKNINEQYADALDFTNKALTKISNDKQCSIDEAKSYLTLTGHSLGGILTQQIGANLGIKGYAYNPYGVDRLLSLPPNPDSKQIFHSIALYEIMKAVGLTKVHANWAYEHISTISYQDEGAINGDILSNWATNISSAHLGKFIPIFGKNLGLDAHFIASLNHVISEYNDILKHFNSNVTYKELTNAYLATAIVHQGKGYETLQSEFKKIGVFESKDDSLNLDIITTTLNLQNAFSPKHITIPALYTLIHLNPFIVSGIDFPAYKELKKYKDEYSDNYIQDKAVMFKKALDGKAAINGIYFKDYETNLDLDTTQDFNGMYDEYHFGTNSNDTIEPMGTNISLDKNRIYALGGDDHIKAPNGSNYIEAGSGNDTIDLRGSEGKNTVYGGVNNGKDNDDDGDDTIYAGQGKDTIYGGNGKDTIYTDNDDKKDLLYGGQGFDTYYVGDKDVIFDSDGKGIVVFEGVELKGGTYDKDKGAYVSKDGLIEYRLNESGGKSTLTVQKGGKSITINEFSKEDKSLGIKLANSKVEVSVTNKEGDDRWLQESLGDRGLPFTMSLNRKLDKGEYLKVEVVISMKGDKSIIEFKEGDISKDFNFTWEDDNYPQGNRYFAVNASVVDESSDLTAEVISSGRGMIKDDDRDPDNPNRPNNPDIPTDPNDPQNAPMYYDPIIIDLNKDGTTTSKLNGAVNFDIDNNGFKEATGWISKDDAFLAYDRNGNGKIDNGNELFGDKTVSVGAYGYTGETAKNGFEALKAFDFNNDNIIDEKDKDFDKLLLWQDLNTNGLTEEGELKTLKEHNVKSIDLRYKETQIDNNGNLIKQTSTVTFNDNTTTTADDVWFKVDLRYTEQPSINIPERIKALPEVTAFGNLHNLRNAMSENSGLENMIKDYISLAPEEKAKQLDNVLFKWAGVEGVDKDSRGQFIDARMLGAYEKISGKPFLQWGNSPNPSLPAANIIMGIMNKFKNYVSANIELQTKYKGLIDTTYMYYNDDTNKYDYDFSKVNAKLKELYNAKNYKELSLLSGIVRDAAQYKSELLDSFKNNLEKLASNNDDFALFALSDYISGTDKDDVIQGKSNHNLFIGGKGDDVFHGGYGKNAYIYHKGDGNDTIHDNGNDSTIYFEDIRRDEVEFSNQGGRGLNIKVKGTQDSINIKQYYIYNDILLKFSDKTVLSGKNISLTVAGDDGDNDLYGYIGNDILEGGKGNDTLNGGYGDDTYVYSKGDGNDIIIDGGGKDVLYFKDLGYNDVQFFKQDSNLLIKVKSTEETIVIRNMLSHLPYKTFSFKFSDGTIRDSSNINIAIVGDDQDNNLCGIFTENTFIGGKGNDVLEGGYGKNTYIYHKGDGNDIIYDWQGNSTIDFKDITRNEVDFVRDNDHLSVKIRDTNEHITVMHFFSFESLSMNFKFADGITVSNEGAKAAVLIGDDNSNSIQGYDSNDILKGNGGDDKLYGNEGNDLLEGGEGNDIIEGGSGNDVYIYDKGDGKDTIVDMGGADVIKFGQGINKEDLVATKNGNEYYKDITLSFKNSPNDSIVIKEMLGYNTINANNKIEALEFANGEKLRIEDIKLNIIGSQENDDINGYKDFSNIIKGNGGDDRIYGGNIDDTIYGGDGNDRLYGSGGDDTLYGNEGNDILEGGSGNDVYIYDKGDGKDTVYDANGTDTIKFGPGVLKQDLIVKRNGYLNDFITISFKSSPNDSITILNVFADNVTKDSNIIETFEFENGERLSFEDIKKLSLIGSNENETLLGYNDSSNIIKGNGGDDRIYGGNINDTIYGGDGNDRLYGSGGDDTLYGNEGNDILEGGSGNDTLMGGKGNDILKGEEGDDIIEGGEGDDDINGYVGDDTLRGNEGDDKIYGGDGNDWLYGGDGNDILYGNEGDDTLMGQDGDDELNGQDGDDIIEGGSGNDTLYGGDGEDTYAFTRGDGQDTIYADIKDTIKFKDGIKADDLMFEISKSQDSSSKDNILIRIKDTSDSILLMNTFEYGNIVGGIDKIVFHDGSSINFNEIVKKTMIASSDNGVTINGLNTDDTIIGGKGDDILYGNKGNDAIYGGSGNDTLHGDAGDDILDGGAGDDRIEGGAGSDTYMFGRGSGKDIVENYDETPGRVDIIKIKNGVSRDDLLVKRVQIDGFDGLLLEIKDTDDSMIVDSLFYARDDYRKIDRIEFEDGSSPIELEEITRTAFNNNVILGDADGRHYYTRGNNSLIDLKQGNDYIEVDGKNVIYMFGKGDGQDTIFGRGGEKDRVDIIRFKEGVTKDDLIFQKPDPYGYGGTLIIKIKDTDDSIAITGDFLFNYNKQSLSRIEFSDGSFMDKEEIRNIMLNGTDIDDTIYSNEDNDVAYGRGGNDIMYGSGKNSILYGGDGDDKLYAQGKDITLYAEAGNDELYAESGGNNTLVGGAGDDTYFCYIPSTQDTVTIDNTGGGDDTLVLRGIVSSKDAKFSKDGNDLLIRGSYDDAGAIRVKNHFLRDDYAVNKIKIEYSGDSITQEGINKLTDIVYLSSQGGNNYLSDKDKKDNVYTYTGGKVTISDNGGDDRVVFKLDNPGDGLFYLSNGRDLKISTNKIDASNNDVLEIKNFFVNRSSIIENFDINDYWSVTAESIYEQYGKTFPPETPDNSTPSDPGGSDESSLTGGSEDNVFNYKGGMVSITDTGGNDKVVFTNPGSRVFYSSDGIDLMISTAKIDSSNNNILQVKNFFASKDNIIETFQINDRWSVTAQSIYKAFGKTYPNQTAPVNNNSTTPPNSDNLIGGKEDNVFTYTGGKKSITDTGGNDKVIFAKQGSKVFYSSDGVNLKISTAKINSSNKDVLEVKNFFSDKNAIIEEFQISDYWTVTAESIYQAFGKTYPTSTDTQNAPLALLGTPNNTNEAGLNDNNSSDT